MTVNQTMTAPAVRARQCPLCEAPAGEPCQDKPAGDHLARYLDAYTAGQLTKAYMAAVLGEFVVIDRCAVVQSAAQGWRWRRPTSGRPPRGRGLGPGSSDFRVGALARTCGYETLRMRPEWDTPIPPLGERSAEAIKAGHEAIEAIDELIRQLHVLRSQLVGELRQDEDVHAARADAMLARLRQERAVMSAPDLAADAAELREIIAGLRLEAADLADKLSQMARSVTSMSTAS